MGPQLVNNKARKSIHPQNNSALCNFVISVCKTSAVHIKIMISATDSYYHRRNLWLLLRNSVSKQTNKQTNKQKCQHEAIFKLWICYQLEKSVVPCSCPSSSHHISQSYVTVLVSRHSSELEMDPRGNTSMRTVALVREELELAA